MHHISAMQVVWHQQLDLWQAWMEPLVPAAPQGMPTQVAGGNDMMQPWTEADSSVAMTMVEMFKSTLLFTHATLASECCCCCCVCVCEREREREREFVVVCILICASNRDTHVHTGSWKSGRSDLV